MFAFPAAIKILFLKAMQFSLFDAPTQVSGYVKKKTGKYVASYRSTRKHANKPKRIPAGKLIEIQAKIAHIIAHAKVDALHASEKGSAYRKIYLAKLETIKGIPDDLLNKAKQTVEGLFEENPKVKMESELKPENKSPQEAAKKAETNNAEAEQLKAASNEAQIAERMEGVKFSRGEAVIKDRNGEARDIAKGVRYGDFLVHKSGNKGPYQTWVVTHIPSGRSVYSKFDNNNSAREAAYRLSLSGAKWDGQGNIPTDFQEKGRAVLNEHFKRQPIQPEPKKRGRPAKVKMESELKPENKAPEDKSATVQAASEGKTQKEPWEMSLDEYAAQDVRILREKEALDNVRMAAAPIRDALAQANWLPLSQSINEKLQEIIAKKPTWKMGAKQGRTAIQEMSDKEWPKVFKNEKAARQLQKTVLAWLRGYKAGWLEPEETIYSSQFHTYANHHAIVKQAVADGKPVPPEVLAGYPDIKPQAKINMQSELKPENKAPEDQDDSKNKAPDDLKPGDPEQEPESVNYETMVKIAADSISKLRAVDVYRVLEESPNQNRAGLASYIKQHRPDLVDDVDDAMIDLPSIDPEPPKPTSPAPKKRGRPAKPKPEGQQNAEPKKRGRPAKVKMQSELKPENKAPEDGPKEGERNADGLVFRNGRWHREEDDATKKEYRYAMVNRPLSIGTVPEGFSRVEERPRKGEPHYDHARHGVVVYNRKLTDQETKNFELAHMAGNDEMGEYVDKVVDMLGEYADGYLEMAEESPDDFKDDVFHKLKSLVSGHMPSIADSDAFINTVKEKLRNKLNAQKQDNSNELTDDIEERKNKSAILQEEEAAAGEYAHNSIMDVMNGRESATIGDVLFNGERISITLKHIRTTGNIAVHLKPKGEKSFPSTYVSSDRTLGAAMAALKERLKEGAQIALREDQLGKAVKGRLDREEAEESAAKKLFDVSTPEARANLIDQIARSVKFRIDEARVTSSMEHEAVDGKWYSTFGMPFLLKRTGKTRITGWNFEDRDGVGFGKRYATKEEAMAALKDAQKQMRIDLRNELTNLTPQKLLGSAKYHLKDKVNDQILRDEESRAQQKNPFQSELKPENKAPEDKHEDGLAFHDERWDPTPAIIMSAKKLSADDALFNDAQIGGDTRISLSLAGRAEAMRQVSYGRLPGLTTEQADALTRLHAIEKEHYKNLRGDYGAAIRELEHVWLGNKQEQQRMFAAQYANKNDEANKLRELNKLVVVDIDPQTKEQYYRITQAGQSLIQSAAFFGNAMVSDRVQQIRDSEKMQSELKPENKAPENKPKKGKAIFSRGEVVIKDRRGDDVLVKGPRVGDFLVQTLGKKGYQEWKVIHIPSKRAVYSHFDDKNDALEVAHQLSLSEAKWDGQSDDPPDDFKEKMSKVLNPYFTAQVNKHYKSKNKAPEDQDDPEPPKPR